MAKKIAIIGAGNLGTRVSLELHNQGIEIVQVYSRTITSALTLAKLIGCPYVTKTELITTDADIYLVSVSDTAIDELLKEVNFNNKLVAHTAGSIAMDELEKISANYGVFYPLQTFSKFQEVDFTQVPICIEGNSPENELILKELALVISRDVRIISSEQRKQLHLAAVFACNFVNHMYSIANEIVQQKNLPFDILIPLISETASKIKNITPPDAQTGPAVRNDKNVISDHLNMLNNDQHLKEIYSLISESINKYQKK
jgi:predicted short-subunit dehydrogenase-like oxidoreductase (DUF2520 family)